MTLPTPEPGLVVQYSFLWSNEHIGGEETGRKHRPCAILLVVTDESEKMDRVLVVPVTHSAPVKSDDGLEMPLAIKRHLGLDNERSWVILTEANDFLWPGPDLTRVGGPSESEFAYGFLPPRFLAELKKRFLALYRQNRVRVVPRTE